MKNLTDKSRDNITLPKQIDGFEQFQVPEKEKLPMHHMQKTLIHHSILILHNIGNTLRNSQLHRYFKLVLDVFLIPPPGLFRTKLIKYRVQAHLESRFPRRLCILPLSPLFLDSFEAFFFPLQVPGLSFYD